VAIGLTKTGYDRTNVLVQELPEFPFITHKVHNKVKQKQLKIKAKLKEIIR